MVRALKINGVSMPDDLLSGHLLFVSGANPADALLALIYAPHKGVGAYRIALQWRI